ncbi:MAG TPA: hypothetical protein VFO85_08515, partial [Vicinamibacteria bacterium]|nr:hypothetical protein [Vicinamibacteria bacterium]
MREWFVMNRGRIGDGILAAVVVAQASPLVQQRPVISLAVACVGAYLRASGRHKSDEYYRERRTD